MFIDFLDIELNRHNDSMIPRCLFYADDGALLAPDVKKAKTLVKIADAWAKKEGMIHIVKKCGLLWKEDIINLMLQGN